MAIKPGEVVVKDKGYRMMALRQSLLRGWKLSVGVHGQEGNRGDEDEPDNVQLAVWHEFGTSDGHVPERSFLRSAFDKNRGKYERMLPVVTRRAMNGRITPKQALETMGERMVADIVNGINRGIPPPLAPSTLRQKGPKTKPLINTGQLKMSITYKVRK